MQAVFVMSRGALAFLFCAGCAGEIGRRPAGPAGDGRVEHDGASTGGVTGANPSISVDDLENLDCSGIQAGAAPLRRLTAFEYDNTVRDLLGDDTGPASRLLSTAGAATAQTAVSALVAEQYMTAAEEVAEKAAGESHLQALLGCPRDADGEDACARKFVRALLPKAYRRPVAQDEEKALLELFATARSALGYREGIRALLEAVLQSPHFLYRVELPDIDSDDAIPLNGFQIASRLSYLFWGTMPDAALFEAAKEGHLLAKAAVETQARRLLADPRAEPMLESFFSYYLSLDQVLEADKDPDVYPAFNRPIASLMQQETRAFVREVFAKDNGSFRTLMRAPWSMMNQELAAYYGVSGAQGTTFERVALDPNHHAGLLTQGALLAARARAYETSPIHRGIFIRDRVMCGQVPDVPEGLDTTPPDPDPNLTTRERLAEHRANPVCASCHEQLDPLGFAFEHFDGAGRFRADEHGLAIDSSGVVVASDLSTDKAAQVPFDGIVDLAGKLVDSPQVQLCFSKHWFRHAYGRVEGLQDLCALRTALTAFQSSTLDVRELLVGLTQTDAFFYRSPDTDI